MPTISDYLLDESDEPKGQTIESFLLSPEPPELRTAPQVEGYVPEPEVPRPSTVEAYGPTALRLIGGPAGFVVGAAASPVVGPAGPYAGGAIGAALGEAGAQALEGKGLRPLPIGVAAVGGAISPAPTGRLAETAAREGLTNLGLTAAARYADTGELPSGKEIPLAILLGMAGGAAAEKLAPRGSGVPIPQRGADNPLPPPLAGQLAEGVAGPPAPNAGPLPRFDAPQPLARPEGPPVSPVPIRTRPGEEIAPILGRETDAPVILGPTGRPVIGVPEGPPRLVLPGPEPHQAQARIVQPSGEPFPVDSGSVLRDTLLRRGLPEQEVERILRETAPVRPGPPVNIARPVELLGKERTAGNELLAREAMDELEPGVMQAVKRGGPEAQGPLVLPFRKGEADALFPASPFKDSVEREIEALKAEPLTAAGRKARPGMDQKMRQADILAENAEIAQVSDLRRRFPTLERAAEHAFSIMDRDPVEARSILNAVDVAAADRRFKNLFQDERTVSEILASERGAAVNPLIAGVARAGVGAAIGGTQGETTEERLRNAAIGAGAGAIASPTLVSQILRRTSSDVAKKAAAVDPITSVVSDLGQAARKIEYGAETGDFKLAHAVADDAVANIEKIAAKAETISPDNRLFKVVAETLMPDGETKLRNLETVSGAARVLQRYSALAQKLHAMAQQGDQDAAKLLGTLYGSEERGMVGKVTDFWRGSLVGRVSTGVRNAFDQGTIVATSALDKIMTGVVEGVRTGKPLQGIGRGMHEAYTLGSVAAERAWKGTSEFVHLAQKSPDKLAAALDAYPEQAAKLLAKPEGLEGTLTQKYLQAVNAVNNVQEQFYRKVWVEAEIRNQLARSGIDVDEALRNPEMIPQTVMEQAVQAALVGTFQNSPKGQLGKDIVGLFYDHPGLHAIVPFPRYIANRLQYIIDHNPLAFVRLFTEGQKRAGLDAKIAANQEVLDTLTRSGETVGAAKAQFNIERATAKLDQLDTPDEIIGKWMTGLVMIGAGVALRDTSIAGEKWYEVKPSPGSNKRIDMRPFSTVAGFMFVGELAKQMATQGKVTMSQEDVTQGIALAGMRSGVGLTLVDLVSGRGNATWEGVSSFAADLAGTFGAGFFNPIAQSKDLVGLVDPEQTKLRETRDNPAMRAYGPVLNQIPYLRDVLPASPSPTSAGAKRIEQPGAHFVGFNVQEKSPLEKELARLGIQNSSIYPREESRADQRAITRGQGRILGEVGTDFVRDPNYRVLSRPEKQLAVKELLRGAKQGALAELPQETVARILLRRKPKEVQELLGQ